MYLLPRSNDYTLHYSSHGSIEAVRGAQAVNRSSVAALAFLLWDILTTIDDEVHLIWPRSISYTKIVYFLVRYIPVLVHIAILFVGTEAGSQFHFTPHDCYIWQVFQGVSVATVVILVDTILILRVVALYHGNNIMRNIVFACFALEVIGMITGLALSLPSITYTPTCLVLGYPDHLIIYGASSIAFQTFLFIITLIKFIQAARSGWGGVPLVGLLARDGTWAFFLLFGVFAAQGLMYLMSDKAYTGVLYAWVLTAFSFSGYRILLNMTRLTQDPVSMNIRMTAEHTNPNDQFTTRLFESQSDLPPRLLDSFENSTSAKHHRSETSTLSLAPSRR